MQRVTPGAAPRASIHRTLVRWLLTERLRLAICLLTGITWTAAATAVPLAARAAIDAAVRDDGGGASVWLLALIVGLALVRGASLLVRRALTFTTSSRIATRLRTQLHAHLLGLDRAFHDRSSVGGMLTVTGDDLTQLERFGWLVAVLVNNLLWIVVVVVALVVIDPVLALVAVVPLPALLVVATRMDRALEPPTVAQRRVTGAFASTVAETVTGIRVVHGFGLEQARIDVADDQIADIERSGVAAGRALATYQPLIDLVPNLSLLAVLWVGSRRAIAGDISIGDLTAVSAYVLMVVWPVRFTGIMVSQLRRAVVAAERVVQVLGAEPGIASPEVPTPLPARDPAGAEVRFEGVGFTYPGTTTPVLSGAALVVRPGETVALVGATGSGKSTVARLLGRGYDPDVGRVVLDGVDVRALDLAELRRAVGLVPEDTFLFSGTLRDNVAFGAPDASDDDLAEAAATAGLDDVMAELDDGWATHVGERGHSLSGGQRQRVAIARAVLTDPRVLVLDDATSAVDPSKEHEIRAALDRARSGRTTIVISHRPGTIALADRVVRLVDGRFEVVAATDVWAGRTDEEVA